MTGKPVRVPVVKGATALGAAILAGCGVGIYSSVEEGARRTVKWDCRYEPQTQHAPVYEALYQTWRRVYPVQLDLCNQKLTQNMWIAPGL